MNHVSHGLFFSMVQIGAIAFQLSTEHIIIPLIRRNDTVNIEVLTKNGMPVHTVHLETEEIDSLSGIAVTTEGRIAVLCTTKESQRNSEKHLVLVVRGKRTQAREGWFFSPLIERRNRYSRQ